MHFKRKVPCLETVSLNDSRQVLRSRVAPGSKVNFARNHLYGNVVRQEFHLKVLH